MTEFRYSDNQWRAIEAVIERAPIGYRRYAYAPMQLLQLRGILDGLATGYVSSFNATTGQGTDWDRVETARRRYLSVLKVEGLENTPDYTAVKKALSKPSSMIVELFGDFHKGAREARRFFIEGISTLLFGDLVINKTDRAFSGYVLDLWIVVCEPVLLGEDAIKGDKRSVRDKMRKVLEQLRFEGYRFWETTD